MKIKIRLQEKYVSRDCEKESGEAGHCAVISHKTNKQKACYDDCDTAKKVTHLEEAENQEIKVNFIIDGVNETVSSLPNGHKWRNTSFALELMKQVIEELQPKSIVTKEEVDFLCKKYTNDIGIL